MNEGNTRECFCTEGFLLCPFRVDCRAKGTRVKGKGYFIDLLPCALSNLQVTIPIAM